MKFVNLATVCYLEISLTFRSKSRLKHVFEQEKNLLCRIKLQVNFPDWVIFTVQMLLKIKLLRYRLQKLYFGYRLPY